jgi:hypothetical protein
MKRVPYLIVLTKYEYYQNNQITEEVRFGHVVYIRHDKYTNPKCKTCGKDHLGQLTAEGSILWNSPYVNSYANVDNLYHVVDMR